MNWLHLTESDQLDYLIQSSKNQAVIIFKHSTSCNTSSMIKDRLERQFSDKLSEVPTYYLDLLQFRNISDSIAEIFGIAHESPQVLIVYGGKCTYDASHSSITVSGLLSGISDLKN